MMLYNGIGCRVCVWVSGWMRVCVCVFLSWCFTSTEARWPIRDGDREGRGRQSEGSTAETAGKRPERPWTAARTMEVLRRCPLAIAQRLVHCAVVVLTAVLGQSHKVCMCVCAVYMQSFTLVHA